MIKNLKNYFILISPLKIGVFLINISLILSFVPFGQIFVLADSNILFSDNFDQTESNLTNGWRALAGNLSRKTDQAVSGKALHFDNGESAQRHIATKGYATLTISYNLKIVNFENNDEFRAEYYLDDSLFLTKTFNADQNAQESVVINNPDRKTKLTIRFTNNADHSSEDVGIDNLTVEGSDLPTFYFYDGFESGSFVNGDWVSGGDTNIVHDDIDYKDSDLNNTEIWTDDNSTAQGHSSNDHQTKAHGADLRGDNDATPGHGVLIKVLNTTGYDNIKVRYSRRVEDLEANENFKSFYSIDGGNNWQVLEILTDSNNNDNMISVLFGPLSGAGNNPNFRIKFEINGNHNNDRVYLDDVLIWGDVLSPTTGSITVRKNVLAPDGSDVSDNHIFPVYLGAQDPDQLSEISNVTYSNLSPGEYTINEVLDSDYEFVSFSLDNDNDYSNGAQITVVAGQNIELIITNKQKPGKLTVIKNVVNDLDSEATTTPSDFTIKIKDSNGQEITSFSGQSSPGTEVSLNPGVYFVEETGPEGYFPSYSEDCSGGTIIITSNSQKTCTITNGQIPEGKAALTIIKVVINDNGGIATSGDFSFFMDGSLVDNINLKIKSGETVLLPLDEYDIYEEGPSGYQLKSVSGSSGCYRHKIFLDNSGQAYTCIFTNDDIAPKITLVKEVINNNGGTATSSDFVLKIGESEVESGQTLEVMANTNIAINEVNNVEGYKFVRIEGDGCPSELGGTVNLQPGQSITCTIVNDDIPPKLTLIKEVIGGTATSSDWTLYATSSNYTLSGQSLVVSDETFQAGTYTLSESGGPENYKSLGWSCRGDVQNQGNQITLGLGQEAECTITNTVVVKFHAFKFNDVLGDGVRDINSNPFSVEDSPISNWWIALIRITEPEENGQENNTSTIQVELVDLQLTRVVDLDISTLNGGVLFENVPPGNYKIIEQKCEGWVNTKPANSFSESFFDLFIEINKPGCGLENQEEITPIRAQFDSFIDVSVDSQGNISYGTGLYDVGFGNHKLLSISEQSAIEVTQNSVTITWTTDRPGTSRVVYDTVSHPTLESAPNYGYAFSTDEFDTDPKVTSHSVTITGLNPGTTYYYRVISSASPESVGEEISFSTLFQETRGGVLSGGGIYLSTDNSTTTTSTTTTSTTTTSSQPITVTENSSPDLNFNNFNNITFVPDSSISGEVVDVNTTKLEESNKSQETPTPTQTNISTPIQNDTQITEQTNRPQSSTNTTLLAQIAAVMFNMETMPILLFLIMFVVIIGLIITRIIRKKIK